MANHASAKKRARQNPVRKLRNKSYLSKVKTSVKNFHAACASQKEGSPSQQMETLYKQTQSLLHKAAAKGLMHDNKASRQIARLHKLFLKDTPSPS